MADLGADLPFGQVASKIKEHYGIDLAVCAPRILTERVACELTEADYLPAAGTSNTAERLIVETDGGMVPLVETVAGAADARKGKRTYWREAKVCIAQRQGEAVPKAGVTMGGAPGSGSHPEAAGRGAGIWPPDPGSLGWRRCGLDKRPNRGTVWYSGDLPGRLVPRL